MSQEAESPKRGPGRPPKKKPAQPMARRGIVDNPANPNNRLEFVWADPMTFKSLFTYFKNLKSQDIHLRCSPRGLTFFARDSAETCRVVAQFPGDQMNLYYCDEEFWLGLNREMVEKIFVSVIDRSFHKITLLARHDDHTELVVVFVDTEIDKECHYKITVSQFERDEELYTAENSMTPQALAVYPINFVLTAKQFKKTIMDASYHAEQLSIEKPGRAPLHFTYNRQGVTCHEVYRDPEKIKLCSNIGDDAFFLCRVKLSDIKSLATSMVTDQIQIYCRQEGDILFLSELSDGLTLSTFTSTLR